MMKKLGVKKLRQKHIDLKKKEGLMSS